MQAWGRGGRDEMFISLVRNENQSNFLKKGQLREIQNDQEVYLK